MSVIGHTSAEEVIARLAGRQHGVVSREQLLVHGLNDRKIDWRLRRGSLVLVHAGIYAVGHAALSADGRRMAAVLSGGPGAVVSHVSAAGLWGLLNDGGATTIHLLSVSGSGGRAGGPNVRLHRTRRFAAGDVADVRGIPVTTVARTLVDLSATVPHQRLARAIHEAEVLRLLDVEATLAAIVPGRRGAKQLHALLSAPEDVGDGTFTQALATLCRRHRLPAPRFNAHVGLGDRLVEVDAFFAPERVAVELDSERFHHTRRSFHADRRRDAEMAAAGYLTIRLTWARLKHDAPAVAAELRAILAHRS